MKKFSVWTQINDASSGETIEAETAKKALKKAKKKLKEAMDTEGYCGPLEVFITVFNDNKEGEEEPLLTWSNNDW